MNHQPFEEWLLEDKPLNSTEKLELELHLRMCNHCTALVASGKALRSVKKVSPAAGFTARFQARLAAQRVAERRRTVWGSMLFTFGGLVMLMWLTGPYAASFLTSPAAWITAFIEWMIFALTTFQAIAQASSVLIDVLPGFLSPFIWMVLVSAVAGLSLLWSVSIWRFAQGGVPRGV